MLVKWHSEQQFSRIYFFLQYDVLYCFFSFVFWFQMCSYGLFLSALLSSRKMLAWMNCLSGSISQVLVQTSCML